MWRDITRRKQGERDRQFFVQVADLLRSSHAPDEGLANVCSALCTHLRAASCEVVDTADGKQLQVTPVSPRAWDERERMLISLVGERVDVFCKYVQATEQRFKTLVEAVQDYAIFMVDPDGRVKTWNHGAERLKGYSDAEIIGSHLDLFYPPEQAGLANKLLAHAREHGRVESEGWRMRKDGTRFWANIVITAVFDASGRLEGFAKVTRDFSERRRHDDELRKSLREREVLLQEVHHRVKNNLQVISSLINMQLRRLDKGPMRDAFEETQTRVLAMALIHEKLYQSKDYSRVPFADYGRSLAQNVFHATGMATHEIQLDLAIDDVSLSLDRAIPCGLLINELMTNALKHAFRDRSGTLRVALERQDDGALRLTVADDGIGLPAGFEAGRATSLGLQIVNTLARQLDAQLIVERQHGSSFQLTFSEAA
jgi:PAS domain S-box-containing protein